MDNVKNLMILYNPYYLKNAISTIQSVRNEASHGGYDQQKRV